MLQLRDNLGRNYPTGGQTVVFFSDHGAFGGQTDAGNGTARALGPGDLAGLAAVGRPAGCL